MPSFGEKTMGRKCFALLTGLGVLVSCGLKEVGEKQDVGGDVWTGPGSVVVGNGGDTGVGKHVWYAVGVDYPQGYDWREDNEKESVRCSLVVFANGVPLMKVPVGDQYEVSSDPDMHRMMGNSLYTDFSTGTETVIKRDGVQLLRYPGREMIVAMNVEGENLYTLGQAREGEGFSFRVNGELLFENANGHVFSHLQRCEDGYSFSYYEVIGSGENALERCYHYLAGEVCQVAVREDVKKVWDIVFLDDRICYLATMVGASAPVLVAGDAVDMLEIPSRAEIKNCRFVPGSNDLDIEGMVYQKRMQLSSSLWSGCELIRTFPSGYTVASMCVSEGGICCVLNAADDDVRGIIYKSGESWSVPEGYMSMGGQSMAVIDGMLYVGLTSKEGGDAAVWVDNEMKPLKINGFISQMSFN